MFRIVLVSGDVKQLHVVLPTFNEIPEEMSTGLNSVWCRPYIDGYLCRLTID